MSQGGNINLCHQMATPIYVARWQDQFMSPGDYTNYFYWLTLPIYVIPNTHLFHQLETPIYFSKWWHQFMSSDGNNKLMSPGDETNLGHQVATPTILNSWLRQPMSYPIPNYFTNSCHKAGIPIYVIGWQHQLISPRADSNLCHQVRTAIYWTRRWHHFMSQGGGMNVSFYIYKFISPAWYTSLCHQVAILIYVAMWRHQFILPSGNTNLCH